MPLNDGLRAGGIYYDVGLRFDQLDRDLAEMQKRVASGSGDISIGVGGSGSGGGLAGTLAVAGSLHLSARRWAGWPSR